MTTEANKAVVRRLLQEAFPAADLAALDEFVASDLVDHSPVPGQPPGGQGVRHVLRGLHAGYADLRVTVADHGLTPRELDVLRLLVEGRFDREIGEALFISHRTVMRHVTAILAKLGADNRTAAAALAVRQDLV